MAVGFSGESSQSPVPTPPSCAWRGRATAKRQAMPKSRSDGFFMGVSSIGKVLSLKSNVNAQKSPIDNTLVYGGAPNMPPRREALQRPVHGFANTELLRQSKRPFLNEITLKLKLGNTLFSNERAPTLRQPIPRNLMLKLRKICSDTGDPNLPSPKDYFG
jgi:hypothetical protein